MDMFSPSFRFDSEPGKTTIRRIGNEKLGYDPHSYSLDIAAKILDGSDCLVRTGCGSGKTGMIALVAACFLELAKNSSLAPGMKFSANPAIVVICPTNALEMDIELKLSKQHFKAIAINSELANLEMQDGGNIWARACDQTVLLLSPEMLKSKDCGEFMASKAFQDRVSLLVVDEAHLVHLWSALFRKAYGSIGQTRARLHGRVRLLLLSATLRTGPPLDAVLSSFSLTPGSFHDLHRSNLRCEVRVTTSTIKSSLAKALNFPELKWVVGRPGITIIFTRSRTLTLRIAIYLRRVAPAWRSRIRKCDSTNDIDYDAATFELARSTTEHDCTILVATTVLTLGVDIPNVSRVIVLNLLEFDEEIQQQGRVRRENKVGLTAETYTYVPAAKFERAQQMVNLAKEGKEIGATHLKHLSLSMAERLLAACFSDEVDRQYDNPLADPPCLCKTCVPVPSDSIVDDRDGQDCHCRQDDDSMNIGNRTLTADSICSCMDSAGARKPTRPLSPVRCLCSRCHPGDCERDWLQKHASFKAAIVDAAHTFVHSKWTTMATSILPALPPSPLHEPSATLADAKGRAFIKARLEKLRDTMWEEGRGHNGGFWTPDDYIPDGAINELVANFFELDSPSIVAKIVGDHLIKGEWAERIWKELQIIVVEVLDIHLNLKRADSLKKKEAAERAKEKRRDVRALKVGIRQKLALTGLPTGVEAQRWRYTDMSVDKPGKAHTVTLILSRKDQP